MRDLERLQDVVEYRVSPSQLRIAFLGMLAVACALFAVGVSVGKRLDPGASSLAIDPLAELDRVTGRNSAEEESTEETPPLTYHAELTARPSAPGQPQQAAAAPTADGSEAPVQTAAAETQRPDESEPARPEEPSPGESSIFTLQVASFETREEASQFANDLRSRRHSVFLVRTSTPERGTWFRVRVGPFSSRREATQYQTRFERTERLPTFLVQRRR